MPEDLNWNVTGWLVYDTEKPLPEPALIEEFTEYDDFTLVPYDKQPLFTDPTKEVIFDVIMDNLGDGRP